VSHVTGLLHPHARALLLQIFLAQVLAHFVNLLQQGSLAGPSICIPHGSRALERPHVCHILVEQAIDTPQIIDIEIRELASTLLSQFDSFPRNVMSFSKWNALQTSKSNCGNFLFKIAYYYGFKKMFPTACVVLVCGKR
jgi:hypothetical protein